MKNCFKNLAFIVVIAGMVAFKPSLFAADGTWGVNASGNWSQGSNWSGGVVAGGVGATANITMAISATRTITVDTNPVTLGTLNIGNTGGSYTITGTTLIMDNSGAGAVINRSNTSLADTINVPLLLNDNLTINNGATAGTFAIGGNISSMGNDNLILNATAASGMNLTGTINNQGTITSSGTGTGGVTILGDIGSNVTAITQGSSSSTLTLSGSLVTVNSNGTTITNSGTKALAVAESFNGSGNLIINSNGAGTITLGGVLVNNSGQIFNSGNSTGTTTIANIGSNVTAVTQASATSNLTLKNIAVNSAGTTLTNTGGFQMFLNGGAVTGAGDLILNNNSSLTAGILVQNMSVNNSGRIINSGTGSGSVSFTGVPGVGSNVTSIIQNSATSTLILTTIAVNANGTTLVNNGGAAFGISPATTATGVTGTGDLIIQNNTAIANGVNLTSSGATGIVVNNSGNIINESSGIGAESINGASGEVSVGSNVTGITEDSSTSSLTVSRLMQVNATATTLTNENSSGTALLTISGGVSNASGNTTGNLILNNNSAITNGVTLSGATAVNNLGTITNSGTGTGNSLISAVIGTNVTGVIQNSSTSALVLSGVNTYTGATSVQAGNLVVTGSLASGSAVTVGTNAASAAILSGTGTVGGSVITVTTGSNIAYLAAGVNTSGARSDFGSAGTLTIGGNLTIGVGTNLDFDLNTATTVGGNVNDLITIGGVLSFSTSTVFNFNALGTLTTGTAYTLMDAGSITGFDPSDFTATGLANGMTAVFSDSNGDLQVTFTQSSGGTGATVAYFNGAGTDLNTASNYDGDVSSGTPNTSAPSGTTNIFFSANRNGTSTANLSGTLEVNSVTFGAGTGTNSGMSITAGNAADALTIDATNANGNTAGNGITILTGGGSDTVSAPVVLGNDQAWTVTDSTSTLTMSGTVSGAHALSTAGAGTVALANAAGNTYTGGTTVGGTSKLLVTNTSGSATGTGALTVNAGATLEGTGSISSSSFAVTGTGTTVDTAANILVGHNSPTDMNTTGRLTLQGSGASSITNAKLTFNLNAGTPGESNTLAVGSTNITFSNDVLTLNLVGTGIVSNSDYLLIDGNSNGQYTGLQTFTNGQGQLQIDGGLLLQFADSSVQSAYSQSYLFLSNGDIEVAVVPEPGTWALMLAGLVMLVVVQRRRSFGRK